MHWNADVGKFAERYQCIDVGQSGNIDRAEARRYVELLCLHLLEDLIVHHSHPITVTFHSQHHTPLKAISRMREIIETLSSLNHACEKPDLAASLKSPNALRGYNMRHWPQTSL